MAGRKRFKQPFDKRGGVLITSTYLMKHKAYLSLMPQAKVLMLLLHEHWRSDKLLDYGIREASEKIPCDSRTVTKAFNQLQDRGFIT
jgi:DNA-binding MarR family transcriptional regulator